MIAWNESRGLPLAGRTAIARTTGARLRGLLGRDVLSAGEGLWIEPCSSVHTWFLRFSLDVVFVDRAGTVVAVREDLRPFRATRVHLRARAALELPAGTVRSTGTRPGDRVVLKDA